MRYINKQRDGSSCGPVALTNVVKWATGKGNGNELIKEFAKKLKKERYCGVDTSSVDEVLRTLPVKIVATVIKPSIRKFDKYLRQGHIALIGYVYTEHNPKRVAGHFAVCLSKEKPFTVPLGEEEHYYRMLNDSFGDITPESMKARLKGQHIGPGEEYKTVVWFLKK